MQLVIIKEQLYEPIQELDKTLKKSDYATHTQGGSMSPQFYNRNEVVLAKEHRKDQKQRDEAENGRLPYLFLKPGATIVRVLPPYNDKGIFYHEILEHAATIDGQFSPVPCGRPYGIDCAFCNEGEALYAEGGEDAVKAAKEFKPNAKFLWNVIPISTPDGKGGPQYGTKILKTGITVKRDILDLDQNVANGWADVTNVEEGVNIVISRSGSGRTGTKYSVVPHAKRNSLEDVLKVGGLSVNDITLYNLEEVIDSPTEESLASALETTKAAPGFTPASPQQVLTPHPEPANPTHKQVPVSQNIPAPPTPPTKEG